MAQSVARTHETERNNPSVASRHPFSVIHSSCLLTNLTTHIPVASKLVYIAYITYIIYLDQWTAHTIVKVMHATFVMVFVARRCKSIHLAPMSYKYHCKGDVHNASIHHILQRRWIRHITFAMIRYISHQSVIRTIMKVISILHPFIVHCKSIAQCTSPLRNFVASMWFNTSPTNELQVPLWWWYLSDPYIIHCKGAVRCASQSQCDL